MSDREARRHFKIRENLLRDKLAVRVEQSRDTLPRKVEYAIRAGIRRRSFLSGNGEKILKRLLTVARLVHADLTDELFYELLLDWPGLRQTTLLWWQNRLAPEVKLPLIAKLFKEGSLVDDAAKMDVAIALVAARLPNTKTVKDEIKNIVSALNQKQPLDYYAKAWLLSKYGTPDELMIILEPD